MLLDSLERLAKAESPFHGTYVELQRYFERRKDWELIDPKLLAADLPDLDIFELAGALDEATQNGELRVRYTVLTPVTLHSNPGISVLWNQSFSGI